jgi:hypothetical protein
VIVATVASNSASSTVSDGVNSYTLIAKYTSNRPSNVAMFGAIAATTATLTITGATGTIDSVQGASYRQSLGNPSGIFVDQTNSDANSDTSSLATTQNDSLVVAACDASTGCSVGTGYTLNDQIVGSFRVTTEFADGGASGSRTVDFNSTVERGIVCADLVLSGASSATPWANRFSRMINAGGPHAG